MLKTHKFARKPFYVDAVRVSEANIGEVAAWCGGTVETLEDDPTQFVRVKVHRPLTERQTQAYIGDWVLSTGTGFKVYTPKAFDKSFEKVKTLTKAQADAAGIKPPHEPRTPKNPVGPKGKKGPSPKSMPSRRQLTTNVGTAVREAMAAKEAEEQEVYRSAETGQFVTEEVAEANPATTVKETVVRDPKDVAAEELINEVLNP